jgi:hypothetical protein
MLDMIPIPNSKENAKRAFPIAPFKSIDFISSLLALTYYNFYAASQAEKFYSVFKPIRRHSFIELTPYRVNLDDIGK